MLRQLKAKAVTEEDRVFVAKLEQGERDWNDNVASKMLEQRRLVEAGSLSMEQLQAAYAQSNPQMWVNTPGDIVNKMRAENERYMQERKQANDSTASQHDYFHFRWVLRWRSRWAYSLRTRPPNRSANPWASSARWPARLAKREI